jgi:hypothetical protein
MADNLHPQEEPTMMGSKSLLAAGILTVLAGSLGAHAHTFGGLAEAIPYSPGPDPTDIVAGDFDHDGDCDLAVVNANESGGNGSFQVLLNAGNGTFALGDTEVVGGQPKALTSADLDSDGDLDVAVANWSSDSVTILLNDGSADFSIVGTYGVGNAPRDIAAADLDGDCDLDLITTDQFGDTCSQLRNGGNASFTTGPTVGTEDRPSFLELGDVDWDGDADLVVSNEDGDELWILRNDGTGNFDPPQAHLIVSPYNSSLIDLDGDKDLDIAVVTALSVLRVLLNDGAGNFALQPESYPSGNLGIQATDLDSDGDPDIVSGHMLGDSVIVLLNEGDATFGGPIEYAAGDAVRAVVAEDLDGDWDADVASANSELGDSVAVLLNLTGQLQACDLNGDGCCNINDFLILLANWGCYLDP